MSTRDTILDAAAYVIKTRGLGRATTKEIAKAAKFSEATLYKHFEDKEELFVAVLHERVPSFLPLQEALGVTPGAGDVRDNLIEVVRAGCHFYAEGFPMNASIFSEPALLAAHRASLAKRGAGPQRASIALAAYIRREQGLGRLSSEADAAAMSSMLMGACLNYGFLSTFHGREANDDEVDRLAAAAVNTLLDGAGATSERAARL